MSEGSFGSPKRVPAPDDAGHGPLMFVSKGTSATFTLGWARSWLSRLSGAGTRGGGVMPGGTVAYASQKPDDSCEPGGSDTHIEPDWSTMKTTFTGKPLGSGSAVQTWPVM